MKNRSIHVILLGLVAILVGCGKPAYYKCDGVVKLDGKPIPKLQISFVSMDPNAGRPSISMTDDTGRFQMTTGANYGVPPGSYKIIIEDPVAVDGRKTSTEKDYVYVVTRYSSTESELMYQSERHESNYEINLKKE
jgi:hypothetical protein